MLKISQKKIIDIEKVSILLLKYVERHWVVVTPSKIVILNSNFTVKFVSNLKLDGKYQNSYNINENHLVLAFDNKIMSVRYEDDSFVLLE